MRLIRCVALAGFLLSGCVSVSTTGRSEVRISAEDGAPLSGQAYGKGRRAVLLVPGGHGIGETWDLQSRRLAKAGFRVLAIDYRGRGVRPFVGPDDEKADLDVLGAVRHLRAEGAEQVFVVGASWGGWAAGTAAVAQPGLIDRIVLLAHSPFDYPQRLGGRKLFIVAGEDRDGTGRRRLEAISEQYERAADPKSLVVLEGAAHAQFLFLTPQGERLFAEMLSFLSAP